MIGVILLGHGSTDDRADAAMRSFAEALQGEWPDVVVGHAYLDHCAPTLDAAVESLPATVTRIVVVPMLLSRAFHAKVDVPRLVRSLDADLPVLLAHPLGPDPELAANASAHIDGPLVVAVSGTSDAAARDAFDHLATYLKSLRNAPVVVGYASMAGPDVPAAIAQIAARGVLCFTLFPGVFSDRIADAAYDAGIPCTEPVYGLARLRAVVRERVQQALEEADA